MSSNAVVRARIDEQVKEEATAVLAEIGLSVSDAMRLLLTRVAREKALPFELRVPNKLTAETLARSERDEDVHRFDSSEAMFKSLGL